MEIKELIDAGWDYHGAGLYSFEDSESMSLRDALNLHRQSNKNSTQIMHEEIVENCLKKFIKFVFKSGK